MIRKIWLLWPLVTLQLIICENLDLSEWMRSSRQLGNEDGVALGLVSALQKWATSLESESSTLKKELTDVKLSNNRLTDEMKLIKSQNINLRNEVTQANERSMNIKSLYQQLGDKFGKIEKENTELKTAFQVSPLTNCV